MKRQQRRRVERTEQRSQLSAQRAQRLDRARPIPKLPNDLKPMLVRYSPQDTADVRRVLRNAGVIVDLDDHLHNHPGAVSKVTCEPLLAAALLDLGNTGKYHRKGTTMGLAGFPMRDSEEWGFVGPNGWDQATYRVAAEQQKRLEDALREGWDTKDGRRDMTWLAGRLLGASIPRRMRRQIRAIAVDSTDNESYALTKEFTKEKELRARDAQRKGANSKKFDPDKVLGHDPMVQYIESALEDPDAEEPSLPAPDAPSHKIGELGPDGRYNRSHDPDARPGRRSGKGSRESGPFLGYDAHLAVAVPKATWYGDPRHIAIGEGVDPYITAVATRSAGTNPGPAGWELLEQSLNIGEDIAEVLADRAYTTKKSSFVEPAHRLRIDVVMDQPITTVRTADPVYLGKQREPAIDHCGTFLHKFTDPELWKPPEDLNDHEREKWYAERYDTYAWRMNDWLRDGGKQLMCAQCLGKFTSDAKTTMKPSAGAKRSARSPRTTPPGTVPRVDAKGAATCCSGFAKADCCILGNSQKAPFGTRSHRKSYKRRLQVETRIGVLRRQGALSRGWCKAMRLGPNSLGFILLAVWHNIELAREARAKRREQREQRRQAKLAATGTLDGDAGTGEAPPDNESSNDGDGIEDQPARPPP